MLAYPEIDPVAFAPGPESLEVALFSPEAIPWEALAFRVTLGLNHEQQHQELLLQIQDLLKHHLIPLLNPLSCIRTELIKLQLLHLRDNHIESVDGLSESNRCLQYLNLRSNHISSKLEIHKLKVG